MLPPPPAEDRPRLGRRLLLLGGANLALAGAVTHALLRIQVREQSTHAADAALQLRADSLLDPRRGDIIDARAKPMAVTRIVDRLIISPGVLSDAGLAALLEFVARHTGIELHELRHRIRERGSQYTVLAEDLDPVLTAPIQKAIRSGQAGGLQIESRQNRRYPSGPLAAHLLGFTDASNSGRSGVESYYDLQLRGRPGRVIADRDPLGRSIPVGREIVTAAEPGSSVRLTLDRRVQLRVEEILQRALVKYGSAHGTILVIDPRDGAVLAMASQPTFDPDRMHEYAEIGPQFLNPAVQLVWEPGSTFKLITMAAGLDSGTISSTSTHSFPGRIEYGGLSISNWDQKTYPNQDMTGVLRHSSNTGAVWIADRMGPEKFYRYLRAFGIGEPTGVDLAGEIGGIVRYYRDPGWYPGDLAANSFGQGLAITPLQAAMCYAAIANGGMLLRPRTVAALIDPAGRVTPNPPAVRRRAITAGTAGRLVAMMRDAERSIPNNPALSPRFDTAGKTATTEVPISSGYSEDSSIPSYTGFGPTRDPRVLVLVKIDAPANGRWAHEVASPVFREVVEAIFPLLGIPASQD